MQQPVGGTPRAVAPLDLRVRPVTAAQNAVWGMSEHGSVCRPKPGGTVASCDAQDHAAFVAAAQVQLTDALRASARRIAHLTQRGEPELHRQADGSYLYRDAAIAAQIGVDGQVRFGDVYNLEYNPLNPLKVSGNFELNDFVEHDLLGHQVNSSQKSWFLEQTQGLRRQLADAFAAQDAMRTRRMLEQELQNILVAAALDAAHKRAAIFTLWQDCGDDADTRRNRGIVEAFVRTHMPRGSGLGFSDDELEQLNRARASLPRFEPYTSTREALQ